MELSRDFDLDPEFRDGQINLITETLIWYYTFLEGQGIDLDVLDGALRDQIDQGEINADNAWFRYRVAEEYNQSPDRLSLCNS